MYAQSHSENVGTPVHLSSMFLDSGRKLEDPLEKHVHMGWACKLHTHASHSAAPCTTVPTWLACTMCGVNIDKAFLGRAVVTCQESWYSAAFCAKTFVLGRRKPSLASFAILMAVPFHNHLVHDASVWTLRGLSKTINHNQPHPCCWSHS